MLLLYGVLLLFFTSRLNFIACQNHPTFLSQEQTPATIRSRVDRRAGKSKDLSSLKSISNLLPPPAPYQTVGDYFDKLDKVLNDTSNGLELSDDKDSQITERDLVRTSDYLKSVWYDGKEHYNISISKCIHFSETIGKWTNLDGTTLTNATLSDINADLQTNITSMADLSSHLHSRLIANTALAASEAERFLNSTICNFKQPAADDHDELRKLLSPDPLNQLNTKFLAMDGYWTGVLLSMGATAAVGGSLYKGFYNRNASAENVALACFTAAGLVLTRGIIERLYMNGMLQYTEASVISAFTAWFRQAVELGSSLQKEYLQQVGADHQVSGCLEEIVIESGLDGLQGYSEPGAGIIELVPMGRC